MRFYAISEGSMVIFLLIYAIFLSLRENRVCCRNELSSYIV